MRITAKLAGAATLAAALLCATTGTALADPSGPPPETAIVAVADHDLQGLCDQFSVDYDKTSPPNDLYCWDAVNPVTGLPGDTIDTKNSPACEVTRPNGSAADIQLLQENLKTADDTEYCVDIAFVSRNIKSTDGAGILSVLFAKDLDTYAANAGGNVPANLTGAQLTASYSCDANLLNSAYPDAPVTWTPTCGALTG